MQGSNTPEQSTMTAHADAVNLARRLSSRAENDLLQENLYGTFVRVKLSKEKRRAQVFTIDASVSDRNVASSSRVSCVQKQRFVPR